jgi:hypothetical protein
MNPKSADPRRLARSAARPFPKTAAASAAGALLPVNMLFPFKPQPNKTYG